MTSIHAAKRGVPYFRLEVAAAFKSLTAVEKRYAHHLNCAAWHGATVCASQLNSESPKLLRLFYTVFAHNPSLEGLRSAAQVSQDDFDKFVEYAALVYSNLGNHLSFGDSKFIPACDPAVFRAIVEAAGSGNKDQLQSLFDEVFDAVYSTNSGDMMLGHPPQGRSGYYGGRITEGEIQKIDDLLAERRIEKWNTRLFKVGEGHYEVRVFCAVPRREPLSQAPGFVVDLVYGDFADHFQRLVHELEEALKFVSGPEQRQMIQAYIEHFKYGRIDDHKVAQLAWIKDKGPVVESNLGFIETYRDPQGVRAEWSGFVAIVDKEKSKMYAQLVARGSEFIKQLPWGAAFEKETFSNPDFTSLEVLGFASSGIPLGICIPNYDDIRAQGFKNVTLGNSLAAINFNDKINHVTDDDWSLFQSHYLAALAIGVGVHELLGHGTGKLFMQLEDGSYNFDKGAVINPLTAQPVQSWYAPGQSWGSMFSDIANAYEECRAEAVALYLSLNADIQAIFGRSSQPEMRDTVHVIWLNMVRGGLVGLEFYSPEEGKWRQAHCRARFAILSVLLAGPRPLVHIKHDPSLPALDITIDADRIETDGKRAIGDLLMHLNINKAIADVAAGRAYFEGLTAVSEEFKAMRSTVVRMAKPRKQFVQAHTRLSADGEVELLEFDASPAGAIAAMVARHRDIPL